MHHKVFGEGADKAGIITLEESNPEDWQLQHIWIPVSNTVHINNGQPDVSADTLNAIGSLSYTLPLVSSIGDHTVKLYVTFTPDDVAEGVFADVTTAEPITAKTKDGYINLTLLPIDTNIDIDPLLDYTVRYLEVDTNKVLAKEKYVEDVQGVTITEKAIKIEDYEAISPTQQTFVLDKYKVITFYYKKMAKYIVKYLNVDTLDALADDKIVKGVEIGSEITEGAIDILGYDSINLFETMVIDEDNDKNVFIFWYELSDGY